MSFETNPPSDSIKATPRKSSDGLGTGLFATTSIKTGEDVISIQRPFVAVLDTPRLADTCSGCFGRRHLENNVSLKACAGCQVVWYCDKICQAKDWKSAHSLECSIYKKLMPRILPNNARAMLRMVLRIGHRRYTNEERDLFLLLETHIKDIRDKNKSQWNRIALTSKAVKAYSGTDLELDAILEFGARLDVNSFNLVTPLHDRIGLYLDPGAAFINHSCDYNSVVGFDGDELFVKAIRTIQKDEQIFISYIDSTNPCDIRQAELRERYFFDCRCPKCEPGEDPADLLPDPSTIETAERNPIDITVTENSDPSKTVSQVESAMQTLRQTYSWPLTRQPLITLRDELITALLSTGKFNSAFIQAAIRHTRVDPIVYPLDAHPLRNIHAWTLAKQAIHLSQEMDPDPVGTISLYKYDMNFSLIIWSILNDLVNRESQSCTVPSFKKIVRSAYDEVNQEFLVNGLDPNHMREEIKKEWEKMDRLVSLALDKN